MLQCMNPLQCVLCDIALTRLSGPQFWSTGFWSTRLDFDQLTSMLINLVGFWFFFLSRFEWRDIASRNHSLRFSDSSLELFGFRWDVKSWPVSPVSDHKQGLRQPSIQELPLQWLPHVTPSWLPNQMISLILIFGFLCRSSSWWLWPHIGWGRMVWPLLRPQKAVLDHFFCKICF